jgi:hypothetical protein
MSVILPEDKIVIYSKSAHRILHFKKGTDEIETINNIDVNSILVLDDDDSQIPYSLSNDTDKKPLIKLKFITSKDITLSYMFGGISWIPKADIIIEKEPSGILLLSNQLLSPLGQSNPKQNLSQRTTSKFPENNLKSNIVNRLIPSGKKLINSNLQAKIYLSACINNTTGETFNTDTTLIAGSINQPQISSPRANQFYANQSMRLSAVPMNEISNDSYSAVQNNDSLPEDYKSYPLGQVKLYSKDIVPLDSNQVKINKIYSHDLNSGNSVELSYSFNAPDFIPNCKVKMYTSKLTEKIGSFIGESNIKESQKGTDVNISMGSSSVVLCQSSFEELPNVEIQADSTEKDNQTYLVEKSVRLSSKITNCSHENVTLVLKYLFPDRNEKTFSEIPYFTTKDGYTEWHYDLNGIIGNDQQIYNFECIVKWRERVQKPITVSPVYRRNSNENM